jgi:hypothetical protein
MARDLSIFSDYHSKENSLTNYCGLLMKLIYRESPVRFEELLTSLITTDIDIIVGPTFAQQTKMEESIPDLAITQQSFSILFETKTSDWFYEDQIKRHITSINPSADYKILFLLSNFENHNWDVRFQKELAKAKKHGIILQPLTFEDFVKTLDVVCTSDYLKNLLEEFKLYLDRNELLPKWRYLLDVVNCTGTMHEINQEVYMCPESGGAYSHRRAKYFGPYGAKAVETIFEIKAVVVVGKGQAEAIVKWKNEDVKDDKLIKEALNKLNQWKSRIEENKLTSLQVFLLENGETTKFVKDTAGGMYQSKKYFWDIGIECKNSKDLALKLNGRFWTEFSS